MSQSTTTDKSSEHVDPSKLLDSINDATAEPQVLVPIGLYWDEWSRCIGSRYQRDQLYRVGKLDSCSRPWKDFKIAVQAKVAEVSDPEKAKELMDSTFYTKRTTISPTAGAIWELKKKPSWSLD